MTGPLGFAVGLALAGVVVAGISCWIERPYRHWRHHMKRRIVVRWRKLRCRWSGHQMEPTMFITTPERCARCGYEPLAPMIQAWCDHRLREDRRNRRAWERTKHLPMRVEWGDDR